MDQEHKSRLDNNIIASTGQIVASAIGNGLIADVGELPGMIAMVRKSLGASDDMTENSPNREPAVTVRASVKKDHLVCLECGVKAKMLKRHLNTAHGLSPDQYRQRWGLPSDYPVVAPDYAEVRRDLALKIGLGRKPGQRRGRRKKAA